jgi:glycopeptide antibiotics resistance protein
VYLGVLTLKSIDFKRISTRLLKGYSILYLVSFASVFLRPLGNAATTNFIIGKGTFNFIPYLINNPSDWCIWLLTVGNVIFFIPVSFILKANFPKIKIYQQIIIGLIIPIVIEGYQFILKCGDVDIDDLVMNFCGFLIGLILLLIQNKFKKEVT